jgi:hypothetical protein
MLIQADGTAIAVTNVFRGQAAFLICAGSSLVNHDLDKLQRRGNPYDGG